MGSVLKAIVLAAIPVVVFVSFGMLMTRWTDRQRVLDLLEAKKELPPLNSRFFGYHVDAVRRQWTTINEQQMLGIEMRFLELDLVFPLLYGGALFGSLVAAWTMLGRPGNAAAFGALVGITILADWTENLVQLRQLDQFVAHKPLDARWISVASVATILKLSVGGATYVVLLGLSVWMAYRAVTGK